MLTNYLQLFGTARHVPEISKSISTNDDIPLVERGWIVFKGSTARDEKKWINAKSRDAFSIKDVELETYPRGRRLTGCWQSQREREREETRSYRRLTRNGMWTPYGWDLWPTNQPPTRRRFRLRRRRRCRGALIPWLSPRYARIYTRDGIKSNTSL